MFGVEEFHSHVIAKHPYAVTQSPRSWWILVFIAVIWLTSYAAGLPDTGDSLGRRVSRAFGALASAALIISVLQLFTGAQLLPRFVVFVSCIVLLPIFVLVSGVSAASDRRRAEHERVIAVVGGEEAERLVREVKGTLERPVQLVTVLAPDEAFDATEATEPLRDAVAELRATLVVLDRDAQANEAIVSQAAKMHSSGVRIRTLSLFYDEWLGKLPISELERISLLFDINEIHHPVYARSKRFLDIVVALVGVVALVVAIPVVWLLDLVGNRGPLFYQQPRVGKDGSTFSIYKFRTMAPSSEAPTDWTASDDPRLGRVGRAMRRLHVDELPQVYNVLRRDLSVVGPRPEQPHYVERLTETIPFYELRHLVRPGITGWAQVKYDYGASELDALEKLQYEFFYLRHQGLTLDFRIIGRTVRAVVSRGGR